jgi:hypothetical protein
MPVCACVQPHHRHPSFHSLGLLFILLLLLIVITYIRFASCLFMHALLDYLRCSCLCFKYDKDNKSLEQPRGQRADTKGHEIRTSHDLTKRQMGIFAGHDNGRFRREAKRYFIQ